MLNRPLPMHQPVQVPSAGAWTATVLSVGTPAGLVVQVVGLTGVGTRITGCFSALFSPPLAAGDKVFCMMLDGRSADLVVIARRQ